VVQHLLSKCEPLSSNPSTTKRKKKKKKKEKKIIKAKRAWGVAQVVEHLPSRHKARVQAWYHSK
jgi:hypothetical protein